MKIKTHNNQGTNLNKEQMLIIEQEIRNGNKAINENKQNQTQTHNTHVRKQKQKQNIINRNRTQK